MSTSKTVIIPVLLAVTIVAACTVQEQHAPPFAGPSELALRIALQAIPDSILQDGFSQAVLNIDASGVDGRPTRGLALRVEIVEGGVIYDFGTLSAKTVVTGEDGKARVIYTAPPREVGASGEGRRVTLHVTPIGNDFRGDISRSVDIRLVPVGIILPPNDAPVASFTFTPTAPNLLDSVIFDASGSTDEGGPCGSACTYTWDFGDGQTGTGIFTTHAYATVGSFQARLTVTDQRGAASQTAQTVPIGQGTGPNAVFTFSPTTPAVGQTIFFSAAGSTATPGRRIVSYEWDFGSGRTASGVTVSKGYETAGTYVVTLTVTDDAGRTDVATNNVIVTAPGALTAALAVSPATGGTTTDFFFNASASTPAASIVEYRFNFGDGTPAVVGPSATTTHRYIAAGTFTATVTVRDSANRTATAAAQVTVSGPAALTPALTVTPATGSTLTDFFFNASASTPAASIVEYRFTFGDGSPDAVGPSATTTHRYAVTGTFTATVTIRDNANRTATASALVTVTAGAALAARLVVTPTTGDTSTNFVYDASTSTPGSSAIVEYRFNFGDGTPDVVGPSATTTHRYTATGNYVATVAIRDSANNTATSTAVAVTVGTGLQARLTVTPPTGNVATNFFYDARASTPGSTRFLTTYRFVFGDGTFVDSASPTATHTYTTPGTYTATVTVRDDLVPPNTSTATVTVIVTP